MLTYADVCCRMRQVSRAIHLAGLPLAVVAALASVLLPSRNAGGHYAAP
jgi:hypothetical protein